jgi:uncharacterized protein involved in copper resistance
MRTLLVASLFVASSLALAQEAPQAQPKPQSAEEQAKSKELQERIRAEGAAGGTAPVPEEKRRAVNANAGPHKRHVAPKADRLPSDEPVEPPK